MRCSHIKLHRLSIAAKQDGTTCISYIYKRVLHTVSTLMMGDRTFPKHMTVTDV